MTKQRQLILKTLRECNAHPTARELFLMVQQSDSTMAFATVYNNLNALVESGEITRVLTDGDADRYDRAPGAMRHGHMVCENCGKIQDVNDPSLFSMIRERVPRPIHTIDLVLHGLCEDCEKAVTGSAGQQ